MKTRNAYVPGRFEAWTSLPTVTREIVRALKRSRFFKRTAIWSTENIGMEGERSKWGLYRGIPAGVHIEIPSHENTTAFTFGHPAGVHQWVSAYPIRIAGVICEGEFVGPDWVGTCNMSTACWAPSEWVMSRYRHHGVRVPFKVFPHGVHGTMRPFANLRDPKDPFTFLHITHGNFHNRKGTEELITAFRSEFMGYNDVRLVIVTTRPEELVDIVSGDWRIELESPDEPLGPEQVCALMNMAHAYVAPSRAEGYGLLPCEARACHTPVAITRATGHLQHFREGVDVAIEVAPADTMITDVIAGAAVSTVGETIAPKVTVDAIKPALRTLYDNWDLHRANLIASIQAQPEPTWQEAMDPLVSWAAKLAETREDVVRF